jgi:hypothetical protein
MLTAALAKAARIKYFRSIIPFFVFWPPKHFPILGKENLFVLLFLAATDPFLSGTAVL